MGQRTVHSSCTIGLTTVPTAGSNVDAIVADVIEAVRRGRSQGGNQIFHLDKADTDTRVQAYDRIWVKHIKSALMENRFRLVQQPVASLQGDDPNMFDVLVRMLDHQGKEVLPAEFMAAAERNDLLKNIDRWVVGASLSFAAQKKPGCLFVRLSRDSVLDTGFADWLKTQLATGAHEPDRICFQITESIAEQYMNAAVTQLGALKKIGFRIALERFGSGRDPFKLLSAVPLDFIKIDGALVQDLAGNFDTQAQVKKLVEQADQAQDRDHRRARRGRQHHGGALAARRAVHPGLLRERAGRGGHGRRPGAGTLTLAHVSSGPGFVRSR